MFLHQAFKDRIPKRDLRVAILEESSRAIMDHSLSLKISRDALFQNLFFYQRHKITSFMMMDWCLPPLQMIARLEARILKEGQQLLLKRIHNKNLKMDKRPIEQRVLPEIVLLKLHLWLISLSQRFQLLKRTIYFISNHSTDEIQHQVPLKISQKSINRPQSRNHKFKVNSALQTKI